MEKGETYMLPDGWIWTNISELFVIIGGGTPSKNNSRYWGGNINWASVKHTLAKPPMQFSLLICPFYPNQLVPSQLALAQIASSSS